MGGGLNDDGRPQTLSGRRAARQPKLNYIPDWQSRQTKMSDGLHQQTPPYGSVQAILSSHGRQLLPVVPRWVLRVRRKVLSQVRTARGQVFD